MRFDEIPQVARLHGIEKKGRLSLTGVMSKV